LPASCLAEIRPATSFGAPGPGRQAGPFLNAAALIWLFPAIAAM
jgi:hypothetical protein